MKGAEGARLARAAESLRQKDRADKAFFTLAVRKRLLLRSVFSRAVVFTTAFFNTFLEEKSSYGIRFINCTNH